MGIMQDVDDITRRARKLVRDCEGIRQPLDDMFSDGWLAVSKSEFPKGMEWAKDIDDDYAFQESMGAWELAHECPVCGEWVTTGEAFCSEGCRKQKVNGWKLKQIEDKKEKTRNLMGVKA